MVVYGHCGCILAKIVVFGQFGFNPSNWLYSGKVVEFGQKWLLSGKSGCIRDKSGCIRGNWLFSVKSGYIRAKVVVFGQGGCFRAKRFYSGKTCCIGAYLL